MDASLAFPVVLSLRVAVVAMLLSTPCALALAWAQARRDYPLRRFVDALVLLPLVLPPSVVGYLLVIALGRAGPLGSLVERWFGARLLFTPFAATIASAIVAFPILVKTAQPAFEAVPTELEHVARTLGLGPLALFFRVGLRVAWRGVVAAMTLGFGRALGEFGATLMVAGNIPGRTNTMPLEIASAYNAGDDRRAWLYVAILMVASFVVVALAALLSPSRARP